MAGWAEARVYVVTVYKEQVLNHYVIVGARQRIIIDSAEKFPLKLTEDLLRVCCVSDVMGLRISEIRKLVVQIEKKSGKKRKLEVVDLDNEDELKTVMMNDGVIEIFY